MARRTKTTSWLPSIILYVFILPARSDTAPQRNRPKPLNKEVIAMSVAPMLAKTAGLSAALFDFSNS